MYIVYKLNIEIMSKLSEEVRKEINRLRRLEYWKKKGYDKEPDKSEKYKHQNTYGPKKKIIVVNDDEKKRKISEYNKKYYQKQKLKRLQQKECAF